MGVEGIEAEHVTLVSTQASPALKFSFYDIYPATALA
jgi:hypothetical protein